MVEDVSMINKINELFGIPNGENCIHLKISNTNFSGTPNISLICSPDNFEDVVHLKNFIFNFYQIEKFSKEVGYLNKFKWNKNDGTQVVFSENDLMVTSTSTNYTGGLVKSEKHFPEYSRIYWEIRFSTGMSTCSFAGIFPENNNFFSHWLCTCGLANKGYGVMMSSSHLTVLIAGSSSGRLHPHNGKYSVGFYLDMRKNLLKIYVDKKEVDSISLPGGIKYYAGCMVYGAGQHIQLSFPNFYPTN